MRTNRDRVHARWTGILVTVAGLALMGAVRGPEPEAAAAMDRMHAYVVASGGTAWLQSTQKASGVTVGEPAGGVLSGTRYELKVGFWSQVSAGAVCPIVMTGDVNQSGSVAVSDIVYLVNYVFKAGPSPEPCLAAGDVNCSGGVISSDIIYLVGCVLKGGPPPCDVCTMWPAPWSCP